MTIVQSYTIVLHLLSKLLKLFCFVLLLPAVFSVFAKEFFFCGWAFVVSTFISYMFSVILSRIVKRPEDAPEVITIREGAIMVFLSWVCVIFLSALPYTFARVLTFDRALFESVSGWTTTGLTVMPDIDSACKTILLWRSITQFLGGAGFAIIVMGAIIGPTGFGLYHAEGRVDNIVPNVRRSARIIMIIYLSYALAGAIALWLSGLNLFDAVNHSLTALATGGFSTRNDSIAAFNNLAAEVVLIILMFLGATSFGIHYAFWQRNWTALKKNSEPKQMIFLILVSSTLILISASNDQNFANLGLRTILFQVVSALTGTGFSTTDLKSWTTFHVGHFVLVILMLLGGCMDSTSGGIKQYRLTVLGKTLHASFKKFFLPRGSVFDVEIWKGTTKKYLDADLIREAFLVSSLYILTYVVGSTALMLQGYSLEESMFEFASALAGVGLSCGVTNYHMPKSTLWTLMVGMFLGRLEFLVVIYALSKMAKDILHSIFGE
ncbi:TrkH family potassium uptake protein [Pseudothermotoga thermarum]|uniref:Cation transporter n=1 Tax=Pseudothermotoga thermarum DSM 5069 TaxID=688269 RepID=F7YW18_9THEM|nr:TrkH family potassium uptake protein [Pseudothermotoga thermarum]AEH50505.1 cation transporter [Pseudothermotoga thermarum DSM 5069]